MCWIFHEKTICEECRNVTAPISVTQNPSLCAHAAQNSKTHGECPTGSEDVEALLFAGCCGACELRHGGDVVGYRQLMEEDARMAREETERREREREEKKKQAGEK